MRLHTSRNIVRFIFLLLLINFTVSDAQISAVEIVRKADQKAKGNTSLSSITIQTIRPTWKREMSLKVWTKGNNYVLILVTAPQKDKGIVYLKRNKEVWNWIPSIERNIKMPPSMMSQSWMGTDFTNDDLVKEASIIEDYEHTLLGETEVDGRGCYKIQLIPKPQSAVVWGKIILSIDKKEWLMLHAEYFDEEGVLVNTMHASDIKELGGRILPGRLEMIPADKKGNKTVLIYNSLAFDKPMDDSYFSTNNMPKVK
ncbi:MAG: outer membrane lipoprotein-sorting protein [Bacteroidia bacterium]